MFIVPGPIKVLLYVGLVLLLLIIIPGYTDSVMPTRLATPVSRNSEGWLLVLGACAYVDFVRPRFLSTRRPLIWATVIGGALLAAGLALRVAPWPSSVVTLNEVLVALAFLVPYLQLPRPARWPAALVLALAALAAVASQPWRTLEALPPVSAFLTDMAEAIAAVVLLALVFDVIDRGVLADEAPRRLRNALAALLLAVGIVGVHLLTPPDPTSSLEQSLYYVQRTNEAWVAASVILLYYLTRRRTTQPRPRR